MQQELTFVQSGDDVGELALIRPTARCGHAFEEAILVPFGLEAANHPRASVRDRLVVDVDRVLGCQHEADTKGTGLLEDRQDGLLRRRHGRRWYVAKHLVHVDERTKLGRSGLLTHPRDDLRKHEGHHKLALGVRKVRDRDDRCFRALAQHGVDVEGHALHPRTKRWRCQ